MPNPPPIGVRHELHALAREGMPQSAIAGCVGRTCATVNPILRRHAATRTLVPGKFMGDPRMTIPHQYRALFRMVQQDRSISARFLTARMRNLYGMKAGRKTVNNRLLSYGYRAYRPIRNSLLTAIHPPSRYLSSELCDISRNTLVPFARQHFEDYRYQEDNSTPQSPCSGSPWFPSAGEPHQDGAAYKIARLELHRSYVEWMRPWSHQYGQPDPKILLSSTKPCWINGQKSP